MVGRVNVDPMVRDLLLDKAAFRKPGHGEGEVENLADGRALGRGITAIAAQNYIGRDAALAIGRPCQGNEGGISGNQLPHFHCIPDCKNGWITGTHLRIHTDAAGGTKFQACRLGQGGFRPHAHAQYG